MLFPSSFLSLVPLIGLARSRARPYFFVFLTHLPSESGLESVPLESSLLLIGRFDFSLISDGI